ncbi:O-antigen ligase family protein [Desulfobacterota bacterium AH_259_B03_O07]|nr:O-antigen ligase family protein [Desulfobacterota bacterium AH_259_B03_O07]
MFFLTEKFIPLIINIGIIIILLSPLPYGTVETWSVSFFEIVSFLVFGSWLVQQALKGRIEFSYSPLYIFMGLFFLVLIFQIIPLPTQILEIISPNTSNLWEIKNTELTRIFGDNINLTNILSLYPYATKQKLLLYISYALFFIIIANYIKRSDQIRRIFWIVFIVGVIESALGLLQYFTGITQASGEVRASGTYVNPNNFAGFLGMVIPLSLGYSFYLFTKGMKKGNTWKDIIKFNLSTHFILFFVTALMTLSLILSGSRGGILSFLCSIVFFYVLLSLQSSLRVRLLALAIFLIIVMGYSLWIGLDPVIQRFTETKEALPLRTYVWKDTFELIKDFPIFGTGLGTFGLSFTLYKNNAFWPLTFSHTHNDYLELASETGLIGLILVLISIILIYKNAWIVLGSLSPKVDPLRYFLTIGSISGIFAMLIHAFTEFNFQIPANAYYFAFLFGLTISLVKNLERR